MHKYLTPLIGGLLLLAGCKQAITIPDQDYLITMNALGSCWNGSNSAAQCNCAVEKVRQNYAYEGDLRMALQDPAQRTQAQARIQSALTSCNPAPQPTPIK